MGIRVLHFADVHVGMENYGRTDPTSGLSTRVLDFVHRMDDMIEAVTENGVDLIIFAGDAFKTRTPNPTFQREFAHRIRDLAALAPVVLLEGNHDIPPNPSRASSIEIYETLAVENVWVAREYEVRRIETAAGPVIVGTAPYPIRARLMQREESAANSIRQADDQLERALTSILEDLAEETDKLDPDDEMPRLLTGHFTVRGAVLGSERRAMLGRDVQVGLGLLADPRWDYVAMGHIHKHQNLSEGRDGVPAVVYSGSLERIDFGEEGDPKGYCMVDLVRGSTEWRFVPVAARPMVTLRFDCRNDTLPNETIVRKIREHDLKDAIVRLDIKLSPQTDLQINDSRIFNALREAGAFHIAGIHRDVEQPERMRLGSSPEGLSHIELLERYFTHRVQVDEERRKALLDKARSLMDGGGES